MVFLSTNIGGDGSYTSIVDMMFCPSYKVHSVGKSVVLITGISRGLGKRMATYFQNKGFTVLGTVRKEKDYIAW